MHSISRYAVAAIAACISVAAGAQERLVVAGAGSMIPLAQELAKAFAAANPDGAAIHVNPRTMGSTGGIKALEAGSVGIALAARPLKSDETAGNLMHAVGRAPVVFAVHKDVGVADLKESQVCSIYEGKTSSWRHVGGPDAAITRLSRNEDDGSKEAVRQNVACFRQLKESADTAVLVRSSAMVERLTSVPGSIGITELATVEASRGAFKALSLDGVAPSPDAVRKGRYKLVKEYAFVTRGEPRGLAKAFLDFTASPEGRKVLAANGVVTAR